MRWLRQSTQIKVTIGPLVDASDGFTPETGVTLGAADSAELFKHDSGSTVDISGATWAHLADGLYNLTLSSSHTDTLGMATILIADTSVCRPVKEVFLVVPPNVYDSLVLGTDTIYADAVQVSSSATAADKLEAGATGLVTGTCAAGSTTSVVNTNLSETTNDHYNGRTITFTSGNLAGQSATITDYNGSTKALSVTTLTEAPAETDAFVIA